MTDFFTTHGGYGREERALERKFILILTLQLLLLTLLPQSTDARLEPDNRLEVLLRTASSEPVAGVTVTLAPRPAALGGPAFEVAGRSEVTNAGGWVAFERVPQGIWLLSFAGNAEGKPILPIAQQGRPPYGTTTNGGGFTVAVNGISGDDIKIDDAPSSGVQQAVFTGREQVGAWVPEYDLSDPNITPAPLSQLLLTVVPSATALLPTADAGVSAMTAETAARGTLELTPLSVCYVPGILLGLLLLGRALLQRQRVSEGRR